MFDELAQKHWACATDLLPQELCRTLAQECQKLFEDGALQPAAIGHGSTKAQHSEVRGDYTRWLEPTAPASPSQVAFLDFLANLQRALNESFYLALKRYETHFALYPPGTGYDKHVDNHRGSGARKITFILYLNEDWHQGHGGELSIYEPENAQKLITRVEPRLGTFVLFRSELFPHEVEKSQKPRLSLTGWFRDDAL